MANESVGENRQFDKVLSRLDALMKRNQTLRSGSQDHGSLEGFSGPATVFMPEPEELEISVPVLTEIYQGEGLQPIEVAEEDSPPVLTHPLFKESWNDVSSGESRQETVGAPAGENTIQHDVEAFIEDMMPHLREMVVRVIQEELMLAQQTLQARILFEAEQVLRRRFVKEAKPK